MSQPQKTFSYPSPPARNQEAIQLKARRIPFVFNQTAPWSYQRKNEAFLSSLLGGGVGLVCLYDLDVLKPSHMVLIGFILFSLYGLSIRLFYFLASDRKAKNIRTSIVFLFLSWGTSLLTYHLMFESLLQPVSSPYSSWLLSLVAIPTITTALQYLSNKFKFLFRSSRTRTLIVGLTPIGLEIYSQTKTAGISHINVLGFFDYRKDSQISKPEDMHLIFSLDEMVRFINSETIELVIISASIARSDRLIKLMDVLANTTASVAFVPDIFHLDLMNSSIGELGGVPLITLRDTPFYGWKLILKRFFDVSVGSLLFLALIPLFLIISIIIKVSSKGPVFFRQKRVGMGTRPIFIWKFRTMETSNTSQTIGLNGGTGVTSFGAWLRKTSLDELPQLINVIKGEMSIVGPRPFFWKQSEHYRNLVTGYTLRHKVKPGLTGWAQINGLRGPILNTEQLKARVEFDLYYVKNWSFIFDCIIILKSIPKVLLGDKHAF